MIFTEEQKEIQALVHTFAEKEIRPISAAAAFHMKCRGCRFENI